MDLVKSKAKIAPFHIPGSLHCLLITHQGYEAKPLQAFGRLHLLSVLHGAICRQPICKACLPDGRKTPSTYTKQPQLNKKFYFRKFKGEIICTSCPILHKCQVAKTSHILGLIWFCLFFHLVEQYMSFLIVNCV